MTDSTSPSHPASSSVPPALPPGGEHRLVDGLSLVILADDPAGVPEEIRHWVEGADPDAATPSVWLTFQRAVVGWRPGRAVVMASSDRVESAVGALLEGVRHETSLRAIESAASEGWDELEADSALAFESEPMPSTRRDEIKARYRRTVALRASLARVAPYLLSPLMHPPTLGSQIGDRWRERLRMEARYEAVDAQLEVYHDVYDACGQRSSEARLARTGHTLEWAILVVLAVQTVLWLFDVLAGLSAE